MNNCKIKMKQILIQNHIIDGKNDNDNECLQHNNDTMIDKDFFWTHIRKSLIINGSRLHVTRFRFVSCKYYVKNIFRDLNNAYF